MPWFIRVQDKYAGISGEGNVVPSPWKAWRWDTEFFDLAQKWCAGIPGGELVELSEQEMFEYDTICGVHEE